jgi:hypothetical protein
LDGAKKVPPAWVEVSLIMSKRPVLVRPNSKVLKASERKLRVSDAMKGGKRTWSRPCTTPFVAN